MKKSLQTVLALSVILATVACDRSKPGQALLGKWVVSDCPTDRDSEGHVLEFLSDGTVIADGEASRYSVIEGDRLKVENAFGGTVSDYSISGNVLKVTNDGETCTYRRDQEERSDQPSSEKPPEERPEQSSSEGPRAQLQSSPPRRGDHWHAAIGFYICGSFAPNLPEDSDPLGIHSHGDNVVHIHPFDNSATGNRATLDIFFDTVNVELSDDEIQLPRQDAKRNGDDCEGRPGRVQAKVWDGRDPADGGRIVPGDPDEIRPQDGQLITIAFVPDGDTIPKPPSERGLDHLTDVPPTWTTTTGDR